MTCPWSSSSQIDARNSARPPLAEPVSMIQSGAHPLHDLLVHEQIGRRLGDAVPEPRRVAPGQAVPERVDELRLQLVGDRRRTCSAGRRDR